MLWGEASNGPGQRERRRELADVRRDLGEKGDGTVSKEMKRVLGGFVFVIF